MKRKNEQLDEQFQSAFESTLKRQQELREIPRYIRTITYPDTPGSFLENYEDYLDYVTENYIDNMTSIEEEEWYFLTHDHYVNFYNR